MSALNKYLSCCNHKRIKAKHGLDTRLTEAIRMKSHKAQNGFRTASALFLLFSDSSLLSSESSSSSPYDINCIKVSGTASSLALLVTLILSCNFLGDVEDVNLGGGGGGSMVFEGGAGGVCMVFGGGGGKDFGGGGGIPLDEG